MGNQIIISISREYGSEGHTIAKQIAKDLGLPFYDRNMLDEIAKEKGFDPAVFAGVDEKPRNKLLSRRVKGYSNATEDNLAQMQFEFLRKKAASGESFVVLGRCSETILKEYDSLVSIFVTGNKNRKLKHVIEKFSLSKLPPQLKSLNMTHTAADTIITIRILNGVTRVIMMFVSIAAGLVWKGQQNY